MLQSLIRTPSLCRLPIGSAPARFNFIAQGFLRVGLTIAVIVCGLLLVPVDQVIAGSSDDQVLLTQDVTLSENGAASDLFVPRQATVFFDFTVQPGKDVLLMVVTEDQWQAMSAGEKPSGEPLLRTQISGVGTRSISLQRGTYHVAMIPTQGTTRVTMTARARY